MTALTLEERAAAAVLIHARNDEEAGELLDMLGLADQIDPMPLPAPRLQVGEQSDRRCVHCDIPMVSLGTFRTDPDGWRERGYGAHVARGMCRRCRKAIDSKARRARARSGPSGEALQSLSHRLTAMQHTVRGLLKVDPEDENAQALRDALAVVREHLDLARAAAGRLQPDSCAAEEAVA